MKCIVNLERENMDDELIQQARELVKKSKRISALTGAGMSVDSGIPDFRSEGGLWDRYDPNEFATYDSFMSNPKKFWTMGQELAQVLLKAVPNQAHFALANLETCGKLVGIITQNIDNLHQVAGNTRVVELHGNYLKAYCINCKTDYIGEEIHKRVVNGEIPPRCDKCNGILKSAAILFGEPLPASAMKEAIDISRNTDLMIVIGTSLTVYPAAYLPQLAKNSGAKIILNNLDGENRDGVADIVLQGHAESVIPKIIE
jgi:NAD-dependent deacetylase